MRKKEQRLWDRMRKAMNGFGFLNRVENGVGVGDPDVEFIIDGKVAKIELKAVDAWPVRPSTPVLGNDEGLSIDQRNFLHKWRAHGGRAFIFVAVGTELFVFDAKHSESLNRFNAADFKTKSCAFTFKFFVEQFAKGNL